MAESNLAATWDEIRRRIAKKRGYNPDATTWTPEQTVDVNDIIRSGYRLFIKSHEWTFLKPPFDLILPDAQEDVDLPSDFGFLVGPLYFTNDSVSRLCPLERKDVTEIRRLRQQGQVTSGQPKVCAIIADRPGNLKGQRSQLLLWPTPNQEYTVIGRYSVLPSAIDVSHPHPYGGAHHAETLIQACLAASEEFNDTPGSATQHFAKCLQDSIAYDRKVAAQSIDNEDSQYDKRMLRDRFPLAGITTYNGLYSE